MDNYKSAAGTALADANSSAEKIVTAAFSIATAFGAVVALVAPKDSASPLTIALPFACLAVAVGFALWAHAIAVSVDETNNLDVIRQRVREALRRKRWRVAAALAALVVGTIVAGVVLAATYRRDSTASSPSTVQVWLTPQGERLVEKACGRAPAMPLRGEVDDAGALAAAYIELSVDTATCSSGAGTLTLPRGAVAVAKH